MGGVAQERIKTKEIFLNNAWLIYHDRNMSHMRQDTRNTKQTAWGVVEGTQSNARLERAS